VFANLKRAPESLADEIRALPGVAQVRTRVVVDVTLDVPGLPEPASGRLVADTGTAGPDGERSVSAARALYRCGAPGRSAAERSVCAGQ